MTTLVSNDEPVRTIIINRPDCRNAVDPETAATLRTAFLDFEADESAQVAILAGAGGNFCAGFDLKSVGSGKDRYEPEGAGPMQTASSASFTYLASRSASEYTITALIPSSRQARWIRSAISPRLAIRIFLNMEMPVTAYSIWNNG